MKPTDTTLDMYYPLRVLRAYRSNCDDNIQSLDRAIAILEREM